MVFFILIGIILTIVLFVLSIIYSAQTQWKKALFCFIGFFILVGIFYRVAMGPNPSAQLERLENEYGGSEFKKNKQRIAYLNQQSQQKIDDFLAQQLNAFQRKHQIHLLNQWFAPELYLDSAEIPKMVETVNQLNSTKQTNELKLNYVFERKPGLFLFVFYRPAKMKGGNMNVDIPVAYYQVENRRLGLYNVFNFDYSPSNTFFDSDEQMEFLAQKLNCSKSLRDEVLFNCWLSTTLEETKSENSWSGWNEVSMFNQEMLQFRVNGQIFEEFEMNTTPLNDVKPKPFKIIDLKLKQKE